jgi:CMP-N,N'-diacetyllegionaminic acid synthase
MNAARQLSRIAIVPARGGSKGIRGKNLAVVAGESLVTRAVKCAIASKLFREVIVSTDDPLISEDGRRAGAIVPGLRPATLSSDQANIMDTVLHVLRQLDEQQVPVNTICLLEPTSPMRTPKIVRETVITAESPETDSAFTVSIAPTRFHPLKQFMMGDGGFAHFAHPEGNRVVNRQELGVTYVRNGMCYSASRAAIEGGLGFVNGRARLIVVEGPAVNIDEPADLELARQLIEN